MTATLQSGDIRVDQLVSIQIIFDDHADGVVLSVSSTCGPTSPENTNSKECKNGFIALLHSDGTEPSMYTAPEERLSPLEASRQDEDTIVAGIKQSEDSNVICIGPSTPEQADTIGAQDIDECGKPSLAGPAEAGPSQHWSCGYSDEDKIVSSGHSAEQDVRVRFTRSGASVGNSDVAQQERAGFESVSFISQDGCTPPIQDCLLSSQAGEPTSSTPGVHGASEGKAESLSAMQPSSTEASGCGSASMLAVPNLPSPGDLCTSATDHIACNDEPVTPTPRLQTNAPLLPPPTDPHRMTLVLDLDGTLIASEDEPHAPVPFDYCVDEERFVWLRPGLRRFLDSVRPHFEVVLFTAAGESWATSALQRIDPDGTIFDSRLYRDHTVFHGDWPWVKDLSRLGRDLARVVIVDDNPLMFMYQPDNALHVAAYDPQLTGDNDDVLEQVLDILMHKVLIADDVREVLRNLEEPITASCMVARHAAAKAAAASGYTAVLRPGSTSGSQGRKIAGPAATGVPSPQQTACTAAASLTVASARVVNDALANLSAPAPPAAGRLSRRKRRFLKLQQQEQQQQVQQLQQQQRQQGPSIPAHHGSFSGRASALPFPVIATPQHQVDKRNWGTGSRFRGSWGPCANTATAPSAAAAPAMMAPISACVRVPAALESNILSTAATLAATARRPSIIVSRVRGTKQASGGGTGKRSTLSLLQQPEQQLNFKLKLLQLQREQEEERDEEGRLDGDGEHVLTKCAVPVYAESLHGRSDSSPSIVWQRARAGHGSSSIECLPFSNSEARSCALVPTELSGLASIAAAEKSASPAAGCGLDQVCRVPPTARTDAMQVLTSVAIADPSSAFGVNTEQKMDEPKSRTRRRRRRRPAEAPSQDEGCDASGRPMHRIGQLASGK
ncbi:hypothetical protein Vafri_2117 [Volvox africanus]|nr:hypothetical protein Vafri_2117 [Volvox africanus]